MRVLILVSLLLSGYTANAGCKKPTIVAVLDSGFGFKDLGHEAKLCKYGHKDFSMDRQFSVSYNTVDPVPKDTHSHGTNIAGIIDGYAKKANTNYCLVIIKYFSAFQTGQQNLSASIEAIKFATSIKADYINYSGGGPASSESERLAVIQFLNGGGKFVAAAGNEKSDLDLPENKYYPAVYDPRIVVVGNLDNDGKIALSSNYGRYVKQWEVGTNVEAFGLVMTGTSQATAVKTGKMISNFNKCDIGLQ
jgi:hypothetical protein